MDYKSAQNKYPQRDYSLDFLRGLAVIFMIITHALGIFYFGSSRAMNFLIWWGATICFTTFLFVSASVIGIKIELGKVRRLTLYKRSIITLIIYYIAAIILTLLRFGSADFSATVLEILTFQHYPEYIEFIVPFILYDVIFAILPNKWLSKLTNPLVLGFFTVLFFFISKWLYTWTHIPTYIVVLKTFFVGHADLHTFGLFSYFPVYAFGLWWGGYSIAKSKSSLRYMLKQKALLFTMLFISFLALNITSIGEWYRWPPTLYFLMYGLWFSMAILFFYPFIEKVSIVNKFVTYLGTNAFNYFIVHILVLFSIGNLLKWRQYTEINALLILITTILLSTLISVGFNYYKKLFTKE